MTNRNNFRLALIFLSGVFLLSVIWDRIALLGLPAFNNNRQADSRTAQDVGEPGTNSLFWSHTHSHTHVHGASTKRSKIGKISMLYGEPSPLYERALAAHEPHNERFGYPFYVLREQTLPGYWSKPGFILQLLLTELSKPESQRLEWLFWVDVDTVLMNPKIPLEIFLPPPPESPETGNWTHIHTLVSNDHRGLNNGVFFLRVHPYSVDLMTATLSTPNTRPDLALEFGDQTALMYWLNQPQFRAHAMHVPQRWFNAYAGFRGPPQPPGLADTKDLFSDPLQPPTPGKERPNSIREGDLLVHHAGHKSLRLQRMRPWMDAAEQHLPAWELELANTGYESEIRKFWADDAPNEHRTVDRMNAKLEDQRKKKEAAANAAASSSRSSSSTTTTTTMITASTTSAHAREAPAA